MFKLSITTLATAFALCVTACDSTADKPKTDAKADAAKKGDKPDAKDSAGKPETKAGEKDGPATGAISAESAIVAFKAFNEGKFDEASKDFADDIAWTGAGVPPVSGKAAVIEEWNKIKVSFPDIALTPTRVLETEGLMVAEYTMHGTHKGDLMGNAGTDKPVGYNAVLFMWHEGGKITKAAYVPNTVAVLAQTGIAKDMPAPPIPDKPAGAPEIIKGDKNADNEAKLKAWYAAFAGDMKWDVVSKEHFTPESVHYDRSDGNVQKTPEEHKANVEGLAAAFPDVKLTNSAIGSAGEWVVSWGAGTGTHKGDMGPIKATNKAINVSVAEVTLFEGGKIKESSSYMNPAEMMGQMGLLPAPGAPPPAAK